MSNEPQPKVNAVRRWRARPAGTRGTIVIRFAVVILTITIGLVAYNESGNAHRSRDPVSALQNQVADRAANPGPVGITSSRGSQTGPQADLLRAVTWGESKRTEVLLRLGSDPNIIDKNGDTPLIIAATRGYVAIADLLIESGANLNAKNYAGNTALIEASAKGDPELVRLLLSGDADAKTRNLAGLSAADAAMQSGHPEIVRILRSGGRAPTSSQVSEDYSPSWNEARLDPAGKGDASSLQQAVKEANLEKATSLLAKGADVNARDMNGWTPLMNAAFQGHSALVGLLLAHKADPNRTTLNEGRTPLAIAARQHNISIVRILLSAGADPNIRDRSGATAMSDAQRSGDAAIGRLLKQAGVRTPSYGQTVPQADDKP
jgi:ankyrin repeat protein